MYPSRRYLCLGLLAGLTVSMMLFSFGIPVWALPIICTVPPVWELPSCRVLVVPAGQTTSISISGKTMNFKYDPISNIVTRTGGSPGSDGFTPTIGGGYWGSDWGDATVLMVTPYFVVFFFRPLSVLRSMGIEL